MVMSAARKIKLTAGQTRRYAMNMYGVMVTITSPRYMPICETEGGRRVLTHANRIMM